MDLLPTVANLAAAHLRAGRTIDGRNIWPLLSGQGDAVSPHEAFFFYWGNELQAVRSQRWKLHFPHDYKTLVGPRARDGKSSKSEPRRIDLSLFDLNTDRGETTDVAGRHPDVVARLQGLADRARADLGDDLAGARGSGARPAGHQ